MATIVGKVNFIEYHVFGNTSQKTPIGGCSTKQRYSFINNKLKIYVEKDWYLLYKDFGYCNRDDYAD